MMSAGIMSGVNWMRLKLQPRTAGERLDEQRLGEPGHADDQRMPFGENGCQHCADGLVLADDDFAELGANAIAGGLGVLEVAEIVRWQRRCVGHVLQA